MLFPVFLTCNVGKVIGLPRTLGGNDTTCVSGVNFRSWRWALREYPSRTSSAIERCLCPIVMPFWLSWLLFKNVLGFTPSTQPSRAHQSQNDLEQSTSADSTTLFGRAHRGKSTKHTTPNSSLGYSGGRNGKYIPQNCHSGSSSSQNGKIPGLEMATPSAPKAGN